MSEETTAEVLTMPETPSPETGTLPETVGGSWQPRDERWTSRGPSRFAGRPNRPVIIGGCPRSGTTLLRSLLNNHPDLAVPAETNFVIPLWLERVKFGDLRRPENRRAVAEWLFNFEGRGGQRIRAGAFTPEEAIERVVAESAPTMGSIFATCFGLYAQAHGKGRWGDKRPNYAPHVKAVFDLFPDAQFINVIRDPRGAVASRIRLEWEPREKVAAAGSATWETAVANVDEAARRLRPDQLLDVRYEDLVSDPYAVLERICRFADLRDGDTVEEMVTAERLGKFREGWHDRLNEPITTARVDAWKDKLGAHEIALVEHAAGGYFERFGYTRLEGLDATPDPDDLQRLERERRKRARRHQHLAREELKRRLVVYRRPVAAVPPADGLGTGTVKLSTPAAEAEPAAF
jgi:hypothetical protein